MEYSSDTLPVPGLYLYVALIAVIGGSLAVPALVDLWQGASTIPLWVRAIGGCAALLGGVAEAVSRDPDEFATSMSGYWLGLLVLGTVLSFGSVLLRLVL